jgi:hypothetical protein
MIIAFLLHFMYSELKSWRRSLPKMGRTGVYVPRLERLEDRCVPTNFFVTSSVGTGDGTLYAAITNLDLGGPNNRIVFALPTLEGRVSTPITIHLTTQLPVITQNCDIEGQASVMIDRAAGAPDFGILRINAGRVNINGLNLDGGDAVVGGGIAIGAMPGVQTGVQSPVIRISNCSFENDSAVSGGGVSISPGLSAANIRIVNSLFQGDSADALRGAGGGGGGIYCGSGILEISNCRFLENTAVFGGGIAVEGESRLIVTGSTVSGNTTSFSGGGIYLDAQGVFRGDTNSISSSSIVNNRANAGNRFGDGGGIFISDATISTSINLRVCSIIG